MMTRIPTHRINLNRPEMVAVSTIQAYWRIASVSGISFISRQGVGECKQSICHYRLDDGLAADVEDNRLLPG